MKKGPAKMRKRRANADGQKAYILSWLVLVCLTAVTVAVYFLHLGDAGAAVALTIASIKAALILLYFMHLRQESRLLQGMFLMPLLLVWLIIGLTIVDVFYR
jgi:cytochrome c oxidase subunit 4